VSGKILSPSDMKDGLTLVSVADARRYLETMHENRSKSRLEIGVQEANLRESTWYGRISPVFLDEADRAWDGQHRFEAIAATGIPAVMYFIRGVTAEEAEYIDTGRKRSYADMLSMSAVPDYKRQSVLAKYMGLYIRFGIDGIRNPSKYPVSQAEKNRHLNTDAIMKSIHAGEALTRALGCNGSWAAYAVWRSGVGSDGNVPGGGEFTVSPFWESVRTGENLVLGDPALALRNWLSNGSRRERRPADKRLIEMYALATSWNKYVTGQRYKRVNPVFEERANGKKYFPAANVPDFLPADIGDLSRSQLRTAYQNLERGAPAAARLLRDVKFSAAETAK
jgi:hypothetical protein